MQHPLLLFLAAVFAAKLVVLLQLRDHPLLQPEAGAAIRVLQILLGTAAVGFIFIAARAWFEERAAWLAAILAGLTGLFTFYEVLLIPEAFDPFLTAGALAALALGLATDRTSEPARLLKPWGWFAIAALAITIQSWNRPLLSSRGGIDFYIGNNAAADGTYRPLSDEPRVIAEASTGRRLDEWGTSRYFYGLGWSWMTLHPADAVKNVARKLGLVFNAGHIVLEHSYPFYAYDMRTLLGLLFVGPWLLLPLGLAGLALAAIDKRPPGYAIWVAFVPLFALSVAMYVVLERYRLPLLVPLCIGAGAVVDRVALSVRDEEFRPVVAIATVLSIVALAVATNRPTGLPDGRAEERIRMAEALIVRDQIDAAEEWATKAAAIHPRPAAVHLRVAQRLIVHSRPEAALVHLGRARRLEPANADVIYAFGQALINARRPKEAIPHLREAMKAGARVDLAGYDLARALAASGDRAGALQTLQAVRPANPSDAQSWSALGRLAMQLESPSLAAAFFTEAVAANPGDRAAQLDLQRARQALAGGR